MIYIWIALACFAGIIAPIGIGMGIVLWFYIEDWVKKRRYTREAIREAEHILDIYTL